MSRFSHRGVSLVRRLLRLLWRILSVLMIGMAACGPAAPPPPRPEPPKIEQQQVKSRTRRVAGR